MTLPEDDVARVSDWCDSRVPEHARGEMRIECEVGERDLVVVERHVPLPGLGGTAWTRTPIAQLHRAGFLWTLRSCDHLGRFERYAWLAPSTDIGTLLDELDRDPAGVFWA